MIYLRKSKINIGLVTISIQLIIIIFFCLLAVNDITYTSFSMGYYYNVTEQYIRSVNYKIR